MPSELYLVGLTGYIAGLANRYVRRELQMLDGNKIYNTYPDRATSQWVA